MRDKLAELSLTEEQMDRWVTIGTLPEGTTRSSNYADDLPIKQTNNVYDSYSSTQTINSMTPGCRVRLVMNLSGTVPEKKSFSGSSATYGLS